MPCVECKHSSWHDSKDHWEPIPDAGDRRKKLLQVQTDLASKIILYGETEEKHVTLQRTSTSDHAEGRKQWLRDFITRFPRETRNSLTT